MFDMFGDVGIFGDTLMPVMNVKENKETKAKEKETPKKEKTETYKGPITVLFDSMGQIQIEGEKEYTKEQLIDEISEITNCSIFKEHEKQFDLKKIKDSVFLCEPPPHPHGQHEHRNVPFCAFREFCVRQKYPRDPRDTWRIFARMAAQRSLCSL